MQNEGGRFMATEVGGFCGYKKTRYLINEDPQVLQVCARRQKLLLMEIF